jgi:hypothetical protein
MGNDKEIDMIKEMARINGQKFFYRNRAIKATKLLDSEGKNIICSCCGKDKFKLYTSFGGPVYHKNKLISFTKKIFNFVCICGEVKVLYEHTFTYAKVTFGCNVTKFDKVCPDKKQKMDAKCLKCKFCYEK